MKYNKYDNNSIEYLFLFLNYTPMQSIVIRFYIIKACYFW